MAKARATELRKAFVATATAESLNEFKPYADCLGDLSEKEAIKNAATLLTKADVQAVYTG